MKPDWCTAAVSQMLAFAAFRGGLLQSMMPLAHQQDEPLLVSEVMCVRDAPLFPVSAFPFTDVDPGSSEASQMHITCDSSGGSSCWSARAIML